MKLTKSREMAFGNLGMGISALALASAPESACEYNGSRKNAPGKIPCRKLRPRKIAPQKIALQQIVSQENWPP